MVTPGDVPHPRGPSALLVLALSGCADDPAGASATGTSSSDTTQGSTATTASPTTGPGCTPGAVVCSDAGAQTCDADGELAPAVACPAQCVPDVGCVDCVAGTTRCGEAGVERCDDSGTWTVLEACNADQGITCDADAGACVGACLPASLFAAGPGHGPVGCEFYATTTRISKANDDLLAVFVTNPGDEPTTVRATRNFWSGAVLEVAPHTAERIILPWDNALAAPGGASIVSRGAAVHIQSDRPVLVAQYAPAVPDNSNDASLLLPVTSWGTRYPVAAYAGAELQPGTFAEASYVVVASADATRVEVLGPPGLQVHAGAGVDASGAGTVMLDRGDALQVLALAENDPTGSLVSADKPVQVLGAHACARVPTDHDFCDHLEESMPPDVALGRTHVVIPPVTADDPSQRRAQVVRVVALAPRTGVLFQPAVAPAAVLAAGAFLELGPTDQPFVVQTTEPVLVAQYMVGTDWDDSLTDPSLTVATAVESLTAAHWFHTVPGWDATDVDVVARAGTTVQLDGAPLVDWTALGASGWLFGHVRLPPDEASGAHAIVADLPIAASVYSAGAGSSSTSYWRTTGFAHGATGP